MSAVFLYLEYLTHIEFLLHVAAIPLEVLLGALIVERFLANKEKERKRHQFMYIKSYLFRSQMRDLFISNFAALEQPKITMDRIRNSSHAQLLDIRKELADLRYLSDEAIEIVVMEYQKAHGVFREFMEWAIINDFESIFQDMIYLLHFIQDIQIFQAHHPDELFMEHARSEPVLMEKVQAILQQGLYSFLDYVIELKEKQPDILNDLLNDYQATEQMKQSSARPVHNRRFLDKNPPSFFHPDNSSERERRIQGQNCPPLPGVSNANCNAQNTEPK
ncbi:MAG: hypothetical protein ACXWTS_04140 [Methylococcaceae bacterium]